MFEFLCCLNPCRKKKNTEARLSKRVLKSDQNVKILLECEKKGKEVVAKAQERRKYRKVDAKKEATKETNKLSKECEVKFKAFCSKNDEELAKIKDEVAKEIEQKMAKINKQVKENKDKVLKLLMRPRS
ncbi:hypothetical protein M3Y97_00340600 [Aphelenchoides bicaudatus]|nr:hypothetical protein M3Y97_00340600 [Aphelenchoides bicaudatus]